MDVQIYGLKFTNFLQQHWVRETLPQEIKWHLRANRRKVLKQFTIPSVILLLSFKKLQRHKLFLLIIHFITQSVSPVLRFKIWIFFALHCTSLKSWNIFWKSNRTRTELLSRAQTRQYICELIQSGFESNATFFFTWQMQTKNQLYLTSCQLVYLIYT